MHDGVFQGLPECRKSTCFPESKKNLTLRLYEISLSLSFHKIVFPRKQFEITRAYPLPVWNISINTIGRNGVSKRYTKIGKKFHLFDDNEEECIFEGDDKFQFASLSLSLSIVSQAARIKFTLNRVSRWEAEREREDRHAYLIASRHKRGWFVTGHCSSSRPMTGRRASYRANRARTRRSACERYERTRGGGGWQPS